MTDAPAPFDLLSFTVSKPGWGTGSLVAARGADDAYELRTKRIEGGSAVADDVRPYSRNDAVSLERWVRALGFCDDVPSERVEGAGSWALKLAFPDGGGVELGGTTYPAAFPDLLSTMIGLGLPGFGPGGAEAFLADFATPRRGGADAAAARSGAPGASDLSGLLGAGGLGGGASGLPSLPGLDALLGDLAKNPAQAEAALRDQCRQLPASTKRELLDFVRKNDPEHYDWWKRLLG